MENPFRSSVVSLLTVISIFLFIWWSNSSEKEIEKRGYDRGVLESQAEYSAINQEAQKINDQKFRNLIEKTREEENAREKKINSAHADVVDARNELDLLRKSFSEFSGANANTNSSACNGGDPAIGELLSTMEDGINELARKGAEIAEQADAHAADSMMLQKIIESYNK